MKYKIIILLFFGLGYGIVVTAQKKPGFVFITGQLLNFSNQVEVEDMSEYQYLLPKTAERLIIPDSNGYFAIRFALDAPGYFRLGRNILYLSPGDSLTVVIDHSNPGKAGFTGRGNAANTYLENTAFPKAGSYIEAGRNIKASPENTISTILEKAASREKELQQLSGVTKEFKRLEAARIKADIINSLVMGETYSAMRLKLTGDSLQQFKSRYQSVAQPLIEKYSRGFADPSLLQLVVYRDISNQVIRHNGDDKKLQQIKDWEYTYQLVQRLNGISSKDSLSALTPAIDKISTPGYRQAARQTLGSLLAFGKGDLAVDFTAINIDRQPVSLSSLKGKVIYVDLWATWCGPCLEEMPHYEKLKERYKNNPDIAFVSLSIDDAIALWEKNVAARNAGGYQWQINRNKLSAYNIVGIPRSLLIDKNFVIVDTHADLPSSKKIIEAIDRLL